MVSFSLLRGANMQIVKRIVILFCVCFVACILTDSANAGCVTSEPVGHFPGTAANALTGYVAWDGTNGTTATFWFIGQTVPGVQNDGSTSTTGVPPGFRTGGAVPAGSALFRNNWNTAGVGDGCPGTLDASAGCGSTSGDVTAFIFETVSNATSSTHSTSYIAASADWDTTPASFNINCRGALTQSVIPTPTFNSKPGGNTIKMDIPNTAINVAAGSPSLTGLGYQMYINNMGTTTCSSGTLPTNGSTWTAVGSVTAAGGSVTTGVLADGCYVFSLKPVFTNNFTTTNFGPNSLWVGGSPLPVSFSSFTAQFTSGKTVALNWVTATEAGTAGFKVYRTLGGGNWTLITPTMIPAKGLGGLGATYDYVDNVKGKKAYIYKVVEITTNNAAGNSITAKVIQ